MTELSIPTPDDVLDAAHVLQPVAVRTPLLRSPALDRLTGGEILLKCENLQRSGAFKFRGAYNRLHRLDRAAFPGGVVAYSTGNHGQAVATVGRMLDIRATIVMPNDAPANKIAKVHENEGEVVLYDRARESREDIAARIAARSPVAVVMCQRCRFTCQCNAATSSSACSISTTSSMPDWCSRTAAARAPKPVPMIVTWSWGIGWFTGGPSMQWGSSGRTAGWAAICGSAQGLCAELAGPR